MYNIFMPNLEIIKKYWVVIVLVFVVIGGIYFYFLTRPEENENLTIKNDPKLLADQKIIIENAKKEFKGEKNLGYSNLGLKFPIYINDVEIKNVNKDSFIFQYESLPQTEFKEKFKIKELSYNLSDQIKFTTELSANEFINLFTSLLNTSVPKNLTVPVSFSIQFVSEEVLLLDGLEFRTELAQNEAPTHKQFTYNILLNGSLLSSSTGYNAVTILQDLKNPSGTVVKIPNFIPKKIAVQSKKDFDGGNKAMKPALSNDPKFINTFLSKDIKFSENDFSYSNSPVEKIYTFSGNGFLVPLLSKKVFIQNYSAFSGIPYYLSEY